MNDFVNGKNHTGKKTSASGVRGGGGLDPRTKGENLQEQEGESQKKGVSSGI